MTTNERNEKVTIKDVAQRAGVSISTVSRVFNGLDKVSETTREKVLQAMDELHYSPSTIATSMITGETKMILIVIPDFYNSFYSTIVQGAEELLSKNGYYAMVLSTNGTHIEFAQIRNKFDKMIDGIIVIPSDQNIRYYKEWGKPCVIVDRYQQGSGMNAVICDDRLGAYQLTEELLKANHRRIAFLSGPSYLSTVSERLAGFRCACEAYSVSVDESLIIGNEFSDECGYLGTKELLTRDDPPTAIVASNNLLCYGCINALQEMNLSIGRDISLVAYDEHALARYLVPGITVISQPAKKMGERATARLLDIIAKQEGPDYEEIVLGVTLIRRGSVKRLPPLGK